MGRLFFWLHHPVSRPSDKRGGGGETVIQTLREGGGGSLKKNFARPFGPQFGPKIRGRPKSPGPLPWIRHCRPFRIITFREYRTGSITIRVLKSNISNSFYFTVDHLFRGQRSFSVEQITTTQQQRGVWVVGIYMGTQGNGS